MKPNEKSPFAEVRTRMGKIENVRIWLVVSMFLLSLPCNVIGQGVLEYYVSVSGNDNNPGTQALPFMTIGRACKEISPYGWRRSWPTGGIIVWIRDGIYRETVRPIRSGTADAPIRFKAYPDESPVVSGADILNVSWTVHNGNIYKASTTAQFEQLFLDGQMMNEARWPNTPVDDLVHMNRATCDSGTNTSTLVDNALPAGDWNGAYVHITPGSEWNSLVAQIKDYKGGNRFDFVFINGRTWVNDSLKPQSGNPYWLFGSLAGIDVATEWFLDSNADHIYIWCPGNPDPSAHTIEVKKRVHAFDLSNVSHIQIEGLCIFAAGIAMNGAEYCVVDDCHVKYPEHTRFVWSWSGGAVNANYLGGHHNEWKNSSIAYSPTNGIYDAGTYNTVTNCIIHDVDYMAGQHAAITTVGFGGEYTRNTLHNSGRDCIRHQNASGFRIEHNDMFNAGLLTPDLGVTTTYGTDGQGASIAYNYVHDNLAAIGNGIYLDNGTPHYNVHHNLVWNCNHSGIRLNTPSENNKVYNNTILDSCKWAINYWNNPDIVPNPTMLGTKVINNLSKSPIMLVTGQLAPEAHHNGNYTVDANGWPTAYSGAIDAGVVVPGITDGYVGSAPDIGCFEVGTEGWTAGADWSDNTGFSEGFESGEIREPFVSSGDSPWVIDANSYSGYYCAKSGDIEGNQISILEATANARAGKVSFYRKVSSEALCDHLVFYDNGVEVQRWSGQQAWREFDYATTSGTHNLRWVYEKDNSVSEGEDSAWIDEVRVQ